MKLRLWFCVLAILCVAAPAAARDTNQVFKVAAAVESEVGKAKLLDVPFYFAGQKHPAVSELKADASSNRTSSGAFRGDETACRMAFLSALIQLQTRALKEGATAVIDIESTTRDQPLSSPDSYRCIAGSMVVHVGLKGKFVTFK
jgi:hypothetical protein